MREQFDRDLARLRQDLIRTYAQVDLLLHQAVESLIHGDRGQAKKVRRDIRKLEKGSQEMEGRAYNLIVLQNPVASDLRLLQFIIYVNFNLQRMANHVRNIAKTTDQTADHKVPGQLLDLLASLAHLVYRVMGAAIEAIVENDLAAATNLPELDEPVDELYRTFFKSFSKLKATDDVDAAGRVIMAARMLERLSDNSVEIGDRLVFLLTGKRKSLDDLADLDPDELDEMTRAQGIGFTMGQQKLVEVANQVPEVELGGDGTGESEGADATVEAAATDDAAAEAPGQGGEASA